MCAVLNRMYYECINCTFHAQRMRTAAGTGWSAKNKNQT